MIRNPQKMFKFGVTSFDDILTRFDPETHYREGWQNEPLALDYDIIPIWSAWVHKDVAAKLEEGFKKKLPKNLYTDVRYNGISECRVFTEEQSRLLRAKLEKRYPKYYTNSKKNGMHIYYIMLIKKRY